MGRRKRIRNNGYWFYAGRGWVRTDGKSSILLGGEQGKSIKSEDEREEAKRAYARYLTEEGKVAEQPAPNTLTVAEACDAYLDSIREGHDETYRMRADLLFDLCSGYPARFQVKKARLIESNPLKGLKVPVVGKRDTYLSPKTEEAIYRFARPALATADSVPHTPSAASHVTRGPSHAAAKVERAGSPRHGAIEPPMALDRRGGLRRRQWLRFPHTQKARPTTDVCRRQRETAN